MNLNRLFQDEAFFRHVEIQVVEKLSWGAVEVKKWSTGQANTEKADGKRCERSFFFWNSEYIAVAMHLLGPSIGSEIREVIIFLLQLEVLILC